MAPLIRLLFAAWTRNMPSYWAWPRQNHHRYSFVYKLTSPRILSLLGSFGLTLTWSCVPDRCMFRPQGMSSHFGGGVSCSRQFTRYPHFPFFRLSERRERERLATHHHTHTHTRRVNPYSHHRVKIASLNNAKIEKQQKSGNQVENHNYELSGTDTELKSPLLCISSFFWR